MLSGKGLILRLLKKHAKEKNPKKLVKEYRAVLQKEPTDFKTRLRLGDAYIRMGKIEKAIDEYFRVGEHLVEQELYQQAVGMFKRIVGLNPAMIPAYYQLADLYLTRDLFGEAKKQYEKILEVDPKQDRAQEELAKLRKRLTKVTTGQKKVMKETVSKKDPAWDALFHELQKQLTSQLNDDDYENHFHLGIAFKEMGLFDNAIEEFKLSLADASLRYDTYVMMALCHRESERYEESLQLLRNASKLPGLSLKQEQQLYYEMGVTFEENGQVDEAIKAFTRVREITKGDPPAQLELRIERLKAH